MRQGGRLASATGALVLFLLGFVPFVSLIRGGERARWLTDAWSEWTSGTLVVVGITIIVLLIVRRVPPVASLRPLERAVSTWTTHPRAWDIGVPIVALVTYALIAWFVFDGRPLFIDEIIQLLQARIFSEGQLARAVDPDPALRSVLLVADVNGRYFAQFPAGGPAMHAPGWIIGLPWLTGPVCGGTAVALFARWLRITRQPADVAPIALTLFAAAPFWMFMSGSHMNHVPATLMLLLAIVGLARVVEIRRTDPSAPGSRTGGQERDARPGAALVAGLGLGAAATIRPVDALAFALPAAVWFLWRARGFDRRRIVEALAALSGVALPILALLWVNAQTTGSPFLFGYDLLWGKNHGLGFHSAPWGTAHTPARGLELLNLYAMRLQLHLFETPFPALIPAIVALALWRRTDAFDRYLLGASALLLALYAAYWHDGNYLGPRFLTPLVPILCLWAARAGRALREHAAPPVAHRAWVVAMSTGAAVALFVGMPVRARSYAHSSPSLRWDVESASRAAGVRDAIVFVRESWGSALIARMWALGVSRPAAEHLYSRVDACRLERAIAALERSSVRDSAATMQLLEVAERGGAVIPSPYSPDASERFEPGFSYDAGCLAHIAEDRRGFTLYVPLTLARDGNVYLRDLGPLRNRAALERAGAGKRAYLLRPDSASARAEPRFIPVRY